MSYHIWLSSLALSSFYLAFLNCIIVIYKAHNKAPKDSRDWTSKESPRLQFQTLPLIFLLSRFSTLPVSQRRGEPGLIVALGGRLFGVCWSAVMHLVRENLFIGNIGDAASVLEDGSGEVTHVLSVLSSASISFFSEWRSNLVIPVKEIKKVYAGGDDEGDENYDGRKSCLSPDKIVYSLEYAGKDLKFVRMAVPIRDTESENLLDYLEPCLDFIKKSRQEGCILVHCFAGVSRSAAIITAYLMQSEQLSQEDALESLKQSCEFVSPNDGFLEQLKMFEDMGFKVDRDSRIYKKFRVKVLGDAFNRGEKIDISKFAADPGLATDVSSEVTPSRTGESQHSKVYRCKKCRRIVALLENVVDHIPGEGESSFSWHKRKGGNPFQKQDEACSSIFIEPLRWMMAVEEGALEGKLSCIHCDARLGYFNWSGIQCSCGSWITPGFQLQKGRIDVCKV
ncbi:hypothetical protein MLD38_028829 [Melastoma candidum]|uniref:Uncharacterized protein n=1 Tax=Melastoma candidum TaxID=119954 RepID=A0ACB9N1X8_9MYRT|nr:hypothetical protein MLD38_028829 [Melastoma candidum]